MADPISGPPFPWPEKYRENRDKFPEEELRNYIGKHVAWSWDGTHIVASASNEEDLYRLVLQLPIDPERVVFDYVDDPEVAIIGGL